MTNARDRVHVTVVRRPKIAGEERAPRIATIGVAGHSPCASSLWDKLTGTSESSVIRRMTLSRGLPRPAIAWCASRYELASARYLQDHPIMAALERFELELAWAFLDETKH